MFDKIKNLFSSVLGTIYFILSFFLAILPINIVVSHFISNRPLSIFIATVFALFFMGNLILDVIVFVASIIIAFVDFPTRIAIGYVLIFVVLWIIAFLFKKSVK